MKIDYVGRWSSTGSTGPTGNLYGEVHVGRIYTCMDGSGQQDVGLIEDAAFVLDTAACRFVWVGHSNAVPEEFKQVKLVDLHGRGSYIPALIDCHTHLAFAGWRAEEFALKCKGATYQEILARGGGILSTVRHTRAASEEELFQRAWWFFNHMGELGTEVVEAKSGYGLTVEGELKLLRVYRRLSEEKYGGAIVPTFLGAHTIPGEYHGRRSDYVKLVCDEMIPRVAEEKLARFCDVFVEEGAFSVEEGQTILETGKRYGLRPKLHADQLRDGGGAKLAADVGAISADHLEYASDEGLDAMARASVIAVALPIASLYLRQPPLDARRCMERGVKVAVATDFNPGSAPCLDLRLAMLLSCIMNRLAPAEALKGATQYAAQALGIQDTFGSIEAGKSTAIEKLPDDMTIEQWLYHYNPARCMHPELALDFNDLHEHFAPGKQD